MKLLKKVVSGATLSVLAFSLLASTALAQSGQASQATSGVVASSSIIIEGVTYTSTDAKFKEALAKAQHTVVEADGTTYGYVNGADAEKHINRIIAGLGEEVGTLESNYVATFWEHAGYTGAKLDLWSGYNYANLGGTFWNDKISSVKGATLKGLRLYEHRDFGGRSVYLAPNQDVYNLGSYGFNDLASSLIVY